MSSEAPYFRPGGTMDPSAPSYIERAADVQLLEALLRGEYVFLLDSRQKGKSSMVARTIVKLKEKGVRTVKLDLQRIGANVTPEQWYAGLLAEIGQELDLGPKLFEYWSSQQAVGPLARWIGAIQTVVLPSVAAPLVFFIDEVDFVRALPFATDEFFAAIRDCYNRRSEEKGFERLTFCLVGVATPAQLIRNPEITPFNIGTRIEISDFTLAESEPYGKELGGNERNGMLLISRVHHWLNGHPYLTQYLCSHLVGDPSVKSAADVDRLVQRLFLSPEARQREPNFSDVERRLLEPDVPGLSEEERRTQVLELYGKVLRGNRVHASDENPIVATLRLAGISLEDRQTLAVRNRLYRIVFDEKWRRTRLPDAELRRQRGAARVAMLRTAVIAGIVVAAVSAGAVSIWNLSQDRQSALKTLQSQSATLEQTSNEREQALLTLTKRNEEITRVSGERAVALQRLGRQNERLRQLTQERERAIADLKRRTTDLNYANYVRQIASVRNEILVNRWQRVAEVVESTSDNANRGWEWGFLALNVSHGIREEKFLRASTLERQSDGSIAVVTPEAVWDIRTRPAKVVERLKLRQPITPSYRRGNLRVAHVEVPRGTEIYDAGSGERLVPSANYATVMDVDPKRREFLLARDRTLETVELRSIDGNRLLATFTGPYHTDAARFQPDGTILSIHCGEGAKKSEIRQWNRSGKTLSQSTADILYAGGLEISPNGKWYVPWGGAPKIEVRELKSHRVVSVLDHGRPASAIAFSANSQKVLTGSEDGIVRVWDARTGKRDQRLLGHRFAIRSVAFLHEGSQVASMDAGGYLRIWPDQGNPALREFKDHDKFPMGAALSTDGAWLTSMNFEGQLAARNLRNGLARLRTIPDPKGKNVVAPFVDGRDVYNGRPDGTVQRYSARSLSNLRTVQVFPTPVDTLEWLPGHRTLLAGSQRRHFALLDSETMRVLGRIEAKPVRKPVDSAGVEIDDAFAFDQESPQIAVYLGEVGKIQIYSAKNARLLREWKPNRRVLKMAFINGGKELVVSHGASWYVLDGQTVVYDVDTGRKVHAFSHPNQTVNLIEYAPATHTLALGTSDRQYTERVIFLHDSQTRKRRAEVAADPFIFRASFSPDGRRLLTTSEGFSIRLWDCATGAELIQLPATGHARFSSDGMSILQVGFQGAVRVYASAPRTQD